MRAIRFRLTPELLVQALRLPKGTTPIRLYESEKHQMAPSYTMIVTGDQFEEVPEGADVPLVNPVVNIAIDDKGCEETEWSWPLVDDR